MATNPLYIDLLDLLCKINSYFFDLETDLYKIGLLDEQHASNLGSEIARVRMSIYRILDKKEPLEQEVRSVLCSLSADVIDKLSWRLREIAEDRHDDTSHFKQEDTNVRNTDATGCCGTDQEAKKGDKDGD